MQVGRTRTSPRWSRSSGVASAPGELAEDLDPAYVLLMLFAAALAPAVIPQIARQFTGMSADTPAFQAAYAEQLRRVVERLAD